MPMESYPHGIPYHIHVTNQLDAFDLAILSSKSANASSDFFFKCSPQSGNTPLGKAEERPKTKNDHKSKRKEDLR